MAITAIKKLANLSGASVRVVNCENTNTRGSGVIVPQNSSIDTDMWIPWCASSEDFNCGHYIILETSPALEYPELLRPMFWIWQAAHNDGDFVRLSTSGRYENPGNRIGGLSTVGGDRRMVVTDSGIALEQVF